MQLMIKSSKSRYDTDVITGLYFLNLILWL